MRRWLKHILMVMITVALVGGTFLTSTVTPAAAQGGVPLVVSLPTLWEDIVTPDMLAEFEAQYGVDVIPLFDQGTFGFFSVPATMDEQLDATEESVNTADVLYIDPTTLTPEDTLAGYFLDLMPLAQSDPALNSADFLPAAWQSYQWDGGLWALPLSVDAIVVTYDPAAFDAVGLVYPSERWTMDDFANAARLLTEYDTDGSIATPGFTVNSGGDNLGVFLRSLSSAGLYDPATMPNQPSFTDPVLETNLATWYDLTLEGVAISQGIGGNMDIPLRVEGVMGYSERIRLGQQTTTTTRYASLLPGGVAGFNVQGFAVSAGTQYPELAYELAKFLTLRPELASNPFSVAPARYSLDGMQVPTGGNGGNGRVQVNLNVPDTIQPTIDQGLAAGLPVAELRYTAYLRSALTEMNNGMDALSALQTAEAQAVADVQTASARYGMVYLAVTPPASSPTLQAGEIALTCAVNLGVGGRLGGQAELPSQAEWDQLIADFVALDPNVGAVVLESTTSTDLATLAESYDCFILPTNVVQGTDLSPILNLDPLLDTDPTFDRNDVIGNTLAQLQSDNRTWALPLAIQPQMLQYDPEKLAWAGVPEPVNGWTTDTFADALQMLQYYDPDNAPFAPNDPSGAYILMLIGAYGGLPLDFRTDPVTVNFTDPATVDATRQVLDLARDGYIEYNALTDVAGGADIVLVGMGPGAITTNTLSRFLFGAGFSGNADTGSPSWVTTPYPQGTTFGVVAYEITTGYVSATAQNPDAAYRFLSEVSRSPQLFSGMPARQSLVYDPVVAATQGPEIVAVYQQLDMLLRDPNTIVFPTFTGGGGGRGALSFVESYWLNRAMDRYVLEDADLEYELAEAEMLTLAYQECAASIVIDETDGGQGGRQMQAFQQIQQCATSVDPTFNLGN
ncbi:MAG: extracellular solute-binding protein [Chloroflexi bacterium]|nr:extracellular solute-binding protein [Chloroflexota bacterium]